MKNLFNLAYRGLISLAVLLVVLAVAEGFAQMAGTSLVRRMYTPGRLLEFAAIVMVFVIALLLHDIRARNLVPRGDDASR